MISRRYLKQSLKLCLVSTIGLMAPLAPADAFEDNWRERKLETPIGFEDTNDFERAIGFERDADHRRLEVNSIYGSSLSTALGNQINIEAGAGSSVVVNANQINRGHQLAVTVIDETSKDIVDEALDDFEKRK